MILLAVSTGVGIGGAAAWHGLPESPLKVLFVLAAIVGGVFAFAAWPMGMVFWPDDKRMTWPWHVVICTALLSIVLFGLTHPGKALLFGLLLGPIIGTGLFFRYDFFGR